METVWTILGTLSIGSILTLGVTHVIDRKTESRRDRRTFYVELLTLLASRRAYMQSAVFDPGAIVPDAPNERIDSLNALLSIDATDEVKKKAQVCFGLLNRFQVSRSLNVPVDVDEHGRYHHRFDQVKGQSEETRDLLMRMSLGGIADDYGSAVDALAAQVRRELHGQR